MDPVNPYEPDNFYSYPPDEDSYRLVPHDQVFDINPHNEGYSAADIAAALGPHVGPDAVNAFIQQGQLSASSQGGSSQPYPEQGTSSQPVAPQARPFPYQGVYEAMPPESMEAAPSSLYNTWEPRTEASSSQGPSGSWPWGASGSEWTNEGHNLNTNEQGLVLTAQLHLSGNGLPQSLENIAQYSGVDGNRIAGFLAEQQAALPEAGGEGWRDDGSKAPEAGPFPYQEGGYEAIPPDSMQPASSSLWNAWEPRTEPRFSQGPSGSGSDAWKAAPRTEEGYLPPEGAVYSYDPGFGQFRQSQPATGSDPYHSPDAEMLQPTAASISRIERPIPRLPDRSDLGSEPGVDREGRRTPGGKRVSKRGEQEILSLWQAGRKQNQIAKQTGTHRYTVQRVIDKSRVGAPQEGMMMPGGKRVSEFGRQEILSLSQDGRSHQKIAEQTGISRSTVNNVIANSRVGAPREGMRTPGGRHVSELGRKEILRLFQAERSHQEIAKDLGLPRATVQNVIEDSRTGAPGEGMMMPGGRHVSEFGWQEILRLSKDGRAPQKITQQTGISRAIVRNAIKRNGAGKER